jgi:transcriptional regulator with XRE-family HTH domain
MQGNRIREARIKNHLTQEELAEKLGTEKNQISRWENGHKMPRGERLSEIAQTLNVSLDYLMGLSDEPTIRVKIDSLTVEEMQIIVALRQNNDSEALKIIINREKRPLSRV